MTTGEVIALIKAFGGSGGGSSSGGVLVVTETYDGNHSTLNKTWQEIHDAVVGGQMVVFQFTNDDGIFWNYLSSVESVSGYYAVNVFNSGSLANVNYGTDSANGYPVS